MSAEYHQWKKVKVIPEENTANYIEIMKCEKQEKLEYKAEKIPGRPGYVQMYSRVKLDHDP